MELFNRYWKLHVKDRNDAFEFEIKPDQFGESLRIQFEINAAENFRYYGGVIKIFNLDPTKRKQLVFNLLQKEFGTGPLVQLDAGYDDGHGFVFNGAVTRGYTVREVSTGDWVTLLQVGIPLAHDRDVTIQSQAVNNTTLLQFLKAAVEKALTQPDRIPLSKSPSYDANFADAVDAFLNSGKTINDTLGFVGSTIKVLNDIGDQFNLKFYQDHEGFGVTKKNETTTPVVHPLNNTVPELTIDKTTGLIGSPIYTDTGAKIITFLRSEFRLFQLIRIESDILTKNVSILELTHRGDSRSEEWYSEIDSSNLTQTA